MVTFSYGNGKYLFYLNLKDTQLYIYEDKNLKIIKNDYNKKELEYMYHRLYNSFNADINIDVSNFNGSVYSKHLIKDVAKEEVSELVEHIPNVDDILDKINQSGIDSLTQKELDILKNLE